jgi:Holliday junction resolvase RusA-like endonuclease
MTNLLHPFESPSANRFHKRHWSVYAKHKKNCVRWAFIATVGSGLRGCTTRRRVTFISYRKRMLDTDNLSGGLKALRDALVEAGVLRDDSPTWATFTYDQKPASESPTGQPCTVITITEDQ